MKRSILFLFCISFVTIQLISQPVQKIWYDDADVSKFMFNRQDTLRGSITPERIWWDLTYYHLSLSVDIKGKSISGSNKIVYRVVKPSDVMQIDLQEPLKITAVKQDGEELDFNREGNAWFIRLKKTQQSGDINAIIVEYNGVPKEAVRAPWDGGFTWSKDKAGNPFIATSCQGIGASIWWPCKDHMYDEPDSMKVSISVPEGLVAVSNGRLSSIEEQGDGTRTFNWEVHNPISNYAVNLNIGDYLHFSEIYQGEKGALDCDYYVLKDNIKKAREHFKQVALMLEADEYWFGAYPFYEDGYKLVEVPYLGMEHQSSVTYGNHYQNGYLGRDLSGTGWGLKFDFIIIHESGHEWFANSITYKDIADMWIHESFTNYSEGLFVEYHYGKDAGYEYLRGIRQNILNDVPIIGIYDVNHEGSGDMYAKGANMLHTIRQIVNNDKKWRKILRGLNEEFYHKTVVSADIEGYMSKHSGINLSPVFDQYLRTVQIPVLEYYFSGKKLFYRWIDVVEGFNMPVKVYIDGEELWLKPDTSWSQHHINKNQSHLEVDPNFYIGVLNMLGE